jgi:hypothetical protein
VSDGITIDRRQHLHHGDRDHAVTVLRPRLDGGDAAAAGASRQATMVRDPRLIWPDGSFGPDSWVYVTDSQLNRVLFHGQRSIDKLGPHYPIVSADSPRPAGRWCDQPGNAPGATVSPVLSAISTPLADPILVKASCRSPAREPVAGSRIVAALVAVVNRSACGAPAAVARLISVMVFRVSMVVLYAASATTTWSTCLLSCSLSARSTTWPCSC